MFLSVYKLQALTHVFSLYPTRMFFSRQAILESDKICVKKREVIYETMIGKTSLLMFPIYGCAAVIRPLYEKFSSVPVMIRGCIYTVGIFSVEFISGAFLRCFHMCPWDYSQAPLNYKGLIRLDYAPLWFGTGLFFEKILKKLS